MKGEEMAGDENRSDDIARRLLESIYGNDRPDLGGPGWLVPPRVPDLHMVQHLLESFRLEPMQPEDKDQRWLELRLQLRRALEGIVNELIERRQLPASDALWGLVFFETYVVLDSLVRLINGEIDDDDEDEN